MLRRNDPPVEIHVLRRSMAVSICLTLAVFIGTVWFACELNAEPVAENRAFALERWQDGTEE
jgi:hypothetical protein